MNQNIPANLDLTKSLRVFEETVTQLGKVLKDQRVVISDEVGRSKIRINKKGKLNPKTNRRGYHGEWVEPKLLTIYTVSEKGKKIKTGELPITNDGTYGNFQDFLEMVSFGCVVMRKSCCTLAANG